MITPDQIKMLTKMSDPKQLASLKANGLPTVDLDKIKELAIKQKEAIELNITNSLSNAVASLQSKADAIIQEKIEEIERLGKAAGKLVNSLPSSIQGTGGQVASSIRLEVEKLKQAKEHGMSTGNFVPLMAILNPTVNLKSLSKDTVVLPKIDMSSIPMIP